VIENAELWARGIVWRQLYLWLGAKFFWHFESIDEPSYFALRDLSQALQILQLRIESVICAIEPVASSGGTMNSERPPDSIAEFVRAELILTRKYFDSFRQTRTVLYWHFQPKSQVVDVDPAVPCEQWLVREDPKVSAATRLFERCLNSILTQFPLQLQKILQRILIVSVNCHPLGALRIRIKRVQASGQLTVQMLANGLERQSPILLRTIVVVLPVRARFVRLQGVGQAIYEQSGPRLPGQHCGSHQWRLRRGLRVEGFGIVDGTVGERKVRPGQMVNPGTQVISLVEDDMWVQANYKETQLTHVAVGNSAEIKVDAFPGIVLRGKVSNVSPASGSQFSLLPPDNATGNFTKVTQRIPVKITLESDGRVAGKLRPGMSVLATIDTRSAH
jgi:hypothetical protein